MLGCYILFIKSQVEVDKLTVEGRGASTASRRSRESTG
jgi:hypothetical protein